MKAVASFLLAMLLGVPMMAVGYVAQWMIDGFNTGRALHARFHGSKP